MKNKFLYLAAVVAVMMCSCVEIWDCYNVKIINNSPEDISVYYTHVYTANPAGPSTIIPKGESVEYTLCIDKENKDEAYVAFLFSDKGIDITTDDINQGPTDSETRKLLFLKHSLWELIQMDCTITFNGFENE